jgi:hypothetical protein
LNQHDGGEQSAANSMIQDWTASEKKAPFSALLARMPNYSWIGYFNSFDFWLNFLNFPNHSKMNFYLNLNSNSWMSRAKKNCHFHLVQKNEFPLLLIQFANCLVMVFHPIPTVLLSYFFSPILFCSPYLSLYLRRHV